jgi:hypothetical protein
VPLCIALLCFACADAPTLPSATIQSSSSTLEPPADPGSAMRGLVWDTRNLAISGARVQVVAPTRGTIAVTDERGEFVLPWPFTGTVTVRVSKEGFHSSERLVPEPDAPRRPVHLGFELQAIDAPIIVAGLYQLTLTAASECTQLPSVVRQRIYHAQANRNGLGRFSVDLLDGDFPYGGVIWVEVRGELLHVRVVTQPDWVNPFTVLLERLGRDMHLVLSGSADLPLGAPSATAALNGTFSFCAAEPPSPDASEYRCPVQPITCHSANHRLTLTRR